MNRRLSSLQRNIPTVITVTHFFAYNNCFFSMQPLSMYRYNTLPIQDDSQVTNLTKSQVYGYNCYIYHVPLQKDVTYPSLSSNKGFPNLL